MEDSDNELSSPISKGKKQLAGKAGKTKVDGDEEMSDEELSVRFLA